MSNELELLAAIKALSDQVKGQSDLIRSLKTEVLDLKVTVSQQALAIKGQKPCPHAIAQENEERLGNKPIGISDIDF